MRIYHGTLGSNIYLVNSLVHSHSPAAQWLEHRTVVRKGMDLNLAKNSVRDMLSASLIFHDGAKSLPSLFSLDQSLK